MAGQLRLYLEKRREDDSACVAKLEGGEQLRQHLVFTEVFREGVQVVTEVLEELLLLSWLLDLKAKSVLALLDWDSLLCILTQGSHSLLLLQTLLLNIKQMCASDLDLLQEQIALHKAVAQEPSRGSAVLQEAGRAGPDSGVSPYQLTVMGDQGLGDLWTRQ